MANMYWFYQNLEKVLSVDGTYRGTLRSDLFLLSWSELLQIIQKADGEYRCPLQIPALIGQP